MGLLSCSFETSERDVFFCVVNSSCLLLMSVSDV